MRLPDIVYGFLLALMREQKAIRDQEARHRIDNQDRALRAWADTALIAHNAGRCIERCPFWHYVG
jgi:hypothetical protein